MTGVSSSLEDADQTQWQRWTPWAAAAVVFVIYLQSMNPTYGFIDKGELAAVATTLGIAHPTGYPILTLLGYVSTRLSPLRPVLTLNVLAALLTAVGVGLMAAVFEQILSLQLARPEEVPSAAPRQQRRVQVRRKGGAATPSSNTGTSPTPTQRALMAGTAALCIGFTTTWWSQATGFEVYALHALLLPLITLLFVRYLMGLESTGPGESMSWPGTAFAFTLGLSFTNHLATIMLAPAFLFLYFWSRGFGARAWRGILTLAPGFIVGLLPYAYLPIRARMAPRLNWGNPSTWQALMDHVMGKQFQFAMKYDPRVFRQQTAYLFNTLLSDTAYVGLGLAIVGAVYLARHKPVLATWVGLLFGTCLVVSGLYDINDIGNYHLSGFLAVGMALAFGLVFVAERMGGRAAIGCGILLAVGSAALHFREMDESQNFLVEDLTHNVLEALPQNAVVFSGHWDYWTSGALYAQEVEGLRRDVLVLDPESLRSEWYLDHLLKYEPQLTASVEMEANGFRRMIRRFERELFGSADAEAYFKAYFEMIGAMIDRNLATRPFFVTDGVDERLGSGYLRVPSRLVYRLTKDPAYTAEEFPQYQFRAWRQRADPYVLKICELYTMILLARARYEERHGHVAEPRKYGLYALSFDPGFAEEEVPDYPLHIEDQIKEVIRNYRTLRARAAPGN